MIIDRAEGNEFVDLLDTLWYVYTNEADADFETFCRIFKSKGVRNWNWLSYDVPAFALFLNNKYFLLLIVKVLIKLYAVIDKNKSGQVSVDQLMTFFTECTANKGWVFCVCRHMSWSSFNCFFFKLPLIFLVLLLRREIPDVCEPGRAEALFRSIAKDDSQQLDFEDFKKLIPSKNVSSFAKKLNQNSMKEDAFY